jgi:hypothetical protein
MWDFFNRLARVAASGLLVFGCADPGKSGGRGYDPCSEMKFESDRVSRADGELRKIHAGIAEATLVGDTAKVSSLQEKLTQKETARASDQRAMQRAGQACDAEMRSLHRYREPPAKENRVP